MVSIVSTKDFYQVPLFRYNFLPVTTFKVKDWSFCITPDVRDNRNTHTYAHLTFVKPIRSSPRAQNLKLSHIGYVTVYNTRAFFSFHSHLHKIIIMSCNIRFECKTYIIFVKFFLEEWKSYLLTFFELFLRLLPVDFPAT